MPAWTENTIIKDLRVLSETFIPSRIIHRDGQMRVIRDNLAPLIDGERARHMFLHGPPGTGKTSMAKYVLEELKKQVSVYGCYINCWSYSTRFNILYTILHEMGEILSVHRKGTPVDELIEVLKRRVSKKPAVIILDEIDQLEDDKVLYDLLQYPNICLVAVGNKETAFAEVDERIQSRLMAAERIDFPAYGTNELADILADRAEWGLLPNAVTRNQLHRVANLARGDARVALMTLKTLAEDAERKDQDKIPEDAIGKAYERFTKQEQKEAMERLNGHQKLLLAIVGEKKSVKPDELYAEFEKRCKTEKLEEINERTVRKYLERLVRMKAVGSKGEGRWRVYEAGVMSA